MSDRFKLLPEGISSAILCSRIFAINKPSIGRVEKEHILGLANLLEKTALQLQAALTQQAAAIPPEMDVDAVPGMRADYYPEEAWCEGWNACRDAMLAAAPAAPVAVGQDPDGHSEAWPKAGDRCLCPACCRHRRNASAPPAAEQPTGTTSDQYRAELYDEVWGKARSMGYGNVTDALAELERLKAAEQPDTVAVPRELLADMCSLDHDTRIQAERRLLALLGKEGE